MLIQKGGVHMRGLWLIDGSYMYKASRSFQRDNPAYAYKGIDYQKLKARLRGQFRLESMDGYYFDSVPDLSRSAQNSYFNWLKNAEPNGPGLRVKLYGLKRRRVYCRTCGATADIPVQKGVDVALATTALRLFSRYDAMVLSAGDGDFEDFVRYIVEDHDKRFYIAAFDGSISPDLQQFSAENYLLDEHYADVCDDRCFEEPFDGLDDLDGEQLPM